MSDNLIQNQIATIAADLRTVSDATYPLRAAIAPEYDATAAYGIGDYCVRNGLMYKCNTTITSGGEVWNIEHWDEVNVGDSLNDLRSSVIHVGTSAPSNPNVQLWLDTDEPGMSVVSSVNGVTGTVVLDADDVGAMSQLTLLWQNASVNSAFAAQTIAVDLSAYDFIMLDFYTMITSVAQGGAYISRIEPVDGLQRIVNERNGTISGDFGYGSRGFTVTTTGIIFLDGLSQSSWAASGTQNGFMVPYKIYGIKGMTA